MIGEQEEIKILNNEKKKYNIASLLSLKVKRIEIYLFKLHIRVISCVTGSDLVIPTPILAEEDSNLLSCYYS